jgi:hypothetical protein
MFLVCLVAVDGVPSLADVPDIYYIHVFGVSAVSWVPVVDGVLAVAFIPCTFSVSYLM